jgi:SnoaL-like domain
MTGTDQLIRRYFELAPQAADAYFAQFSDDAVVEDEGTTRHGLAAIREWRTEVPAVTYTVQDISTPDAAATGPGTGHEAQVDVTGDFPGSPVRLGFHFQFAADGRITRLTIRP